MQQPAPTAPALLTQHAGFPAQLGVELHDATELDLGYEGAFPFLTENSVADAPRP